MRKHMELTLTIPVKSTSMMRTTTVRKARIRASLTLRITPISTRSGRESRRTQPSTTSSCSRCRPKILNCTSKYRPIPSDSFRCCPEAVAVQARCLQLPRHRQRPSSSNPNLARSRSPTRRWKRSSAFKIWVSPRTSAHRPTSRATRMRTQQRTFCSSQPSKTIKMRRAPQSSNRCSPLNPSSLLSLATTSLAINLMTAPQVTTTTTMRVVIIMTRAAMMTADPPLSE